MNYYKRLHVSPSASPDEIKAAYRKLALQYHPDVAIHGSPSSSPFTQGKKETVTPSSSTADATTTPMTKAEAEAAFRSISEAYAVLSDPAQRKKHDEELERVSLLQKKKTTTTTQEAKRKETSSSPRSSRPPPPPTSSRTTTTASTSTSRSTSSFSSSFFSSQDFGKKKSNFVQRDAERIFREAFNGKTLEEVLFDARRRAKLMADRKLGRLHQEKKKTTTTDPRKGATYAGSSSGPDAEDEKTTSSFQKCGEGSSCKRKSSTASKTASGSSSSFSSKEEEEEQEDFTFSHFHKKSTIDSGPWDEELQRTVERAAERVATKMRHSFSASFHHSTTSSSMASLRQADRMMKVMQSFREAAFASAVAGGGGRGDGDVSGRHLPPLPGLRLSFRPFPNMILPEGVEVPPDPVMGDWAWAEELEKEGVPEEEEENEEEALQASRRRRTREEKNANRKRCMEKRWDPSWMATERMHAKKHWKSSAEEGEEDEGREKEGDEKTLSTSTEPTTTTTAPITEPTEKEKEEDQHTKALGNTRKSTMEPSSTGRTPGRVKVVLTTKTRRPILRKPREKGTIRNACSSSGVPKKDSTEQSDVRTMLNLEEVKEEEAWEEVPREETERLSKRSASLQAFRQTSFADSTGSGERFTFDSISYDSGKDRGVPYNMGQLYSYHRPY